MMQEDLLILYCELLQETIQDAKKYIAKEKVVEIKEEKKNQNKSKNSKEKNKNLNKK